MSKAQPMPLAIAIEKILADGARMQEVETLMRIHLFATRQLHLFKVYDVWKVMRDNEGIETHLFEHVSYSACLEFALNQPIVEKPDEPPH